MKAGIMQPYFFPYIGYWQLMNAVDVYVIYDDVNYIKRGWINRNRILINGSPHFFNLPVCGASQNKRICEIRVNHDERLVRKNLTALKLNYGKAPYFDKVYPLLERILQCRKTNLTEYLRESIEGISSYLDIHTKLLQSSSLKKDDRLKGEEKVLDICRILGADTYINAAGGRGLYSSLRFKEQGIQLYFLETGDIRYRQAGDSFYENLSIIDVMMFNSKEDIKVMLEKYTLAL